MRKLPPIHTAVEEIDDATVAGLAWSYEVKWTDVKIAGRYVRRRCVYGISCFVLCDRTTDRRTIYANGRPLEIPEKTAYIKLLELAKERHGRFEFVGLADGIEDAR